MRIPICLIGLAVCATATAAQAAPLKVRPLLQTYEHGVVLQVMDDVFSICAECGSDELSQAIKPKSAAMPYGVRTSSVSSVSGAGQSVIREIVVQSEEGENDMVAKVFFTFDSARIRPADQKKLSLFADNMKGRGVVLDGYACDLGSRQYNIGLSRRRAATVADFLRARGLSIRQVVGRGEVAGGAADRTLNRRVEIRVIGGNAE